MPITNTTLPFRILHTDTVCNTTNQIQASTLVNRTGALTVAGALGVAAYDRQLPNPADTHPIPLQECFLVVTHGEFAVQFDSLTSFNAMAIGSAVTGLNGKLSTAVGNVPVTLEGGETPRLIAKAVSFDGIGYGLITLR
ncbi:MAG: hypothetical protein ACRDBG_26040 [Waterburya sp.]